MADKIVSWGGFDSKGTSGMGVTGSLSVSGSMTTNADIFLYSTSSRTSNIRFFGQYGAVGQGNYHNLAVDSNNDFVWTSFRGGSYSTTPLTLSGGSSWLIPGTMKIGGINAASISSNGSYTGAYATLTLTGGGYNDATNPSINFITWDAGNTTSRFQIHSRTLGGTNGKIVAVPNNGNFIIGSSTDLSAKLAVKGSGTTSSTTAFLVQNANATASLAVTDSGSVLIGTTTDSGYKLDVRNGTALIHRGIFGLSSTGGQSLRVVASTGGVDNVFSVHNEGSSIQYFGITSNTGLTTFNSNWNIGSRLSADTQSLFIQTDQATAAISTLTVRGGNAISSNRAGGNLILSSGASAGSGDGVNGYIAFKVTNVTASAGVTNSTSEVARFSLGKNLLIGTTTDPGYKLNVSGSGNFTNNLTVTGSATISNVLTLTPQTPLPSGVPTGSFAVSSSVPPKPYFYDGTAWNALY